MKRKYNKFQEVYMMAKANLELLEEREGRIEVRYIADNGIVNQDGSTPERIYCIDDEVIFEKANAECSEIIEKSGLWGEILNAREILKEAEQELIKYGLSIAPKKERDILTKAAKSDYVTKMKIVELVMRLDASTVA